MDTRLHRERVTTDSSGGHTQRRFEAPFAELPDGSFVVVDEAAFLVLGPRLLRWTAAGYDLARERPCGQATVLTPPSVVEVLRRRWAGVVPLVHPSAEALAAV